MVMTLQQLKYILTIVQCGSISEAARQLYLSQPSLSAAVKEIEQEIGVDIFVRSSKGITLSSDGIEFLSYARQVVEQMELLEQKYMDRKPSKKLFSISTQHYAFAVQAFVRLLKEIHAAEYECTLRETRTYEIIEDVRNMRSELGILYLSDFNRKVIENLLRERELTFHPLFTAEPHVFISTAHPLAGQAIIDIEQLDDYPFLAFEQGEYNSFYFSEELFSTRTFKKKILVSDRATLFNLLIGLNGYTISSGVLNQDLNGENIISVRLRSEEKKEIGYITNDRTNLSLLANTYVKMLQAIITEFGIKLPGA